MPTPASSTDPPDQHAAAPWWARSTVYQIYPRSFADASGDGVGDLRGIIEHLDHLSTLGADVIWLSPIYASPQDDNGYDISDYRAIDPAFGTLDDFDELLAEVHARGMKLVMDLVVNHTSDEHPWFLESRSSLDNPKRDWYWWRPPRAGRRAGEPGAEPTNWGSFFSGSTWQYDEATGEYFLHLFSRKQPDLNWEKPAVRQAVYEMMRWWLDRGIDGFRMDVVNLLSKHPDLPDGLVDDAGVGGLGDGSPYYVCGPRIHEFVAEMRREVFDHYDRPLLTVGETPGAIVADARRFTDPASRELDMIFQFEHVGVDHGWSKWDPVPLDWRRLKASLDRWQLGLADTGWNSLYWDNHDQPRAVSRFGDDSDEFRERSAKALATVLHLQRGTPFVYQGDELGMTNAGFRSIEAYRDIETLRYYEAAVAAGADPETVLATVRTVSRDNARTPMQWTAGRHAGFTRGTPWIAVNPNHQTVNAAAEIADERSVFNHYRRLIELRRSEPVVWVGDYEPVLPDHPSIYAYRRRLDTDELTVVANCSSAPVDAAIDRPSPGARVIISNYDDEPRWDGDMVALRPWEAVAFLSSLPAETPTADSGVP